MFAKLLKYFNSCAIDVIWDCYHNSENKPSMIYTWLVWPSKNGDAHLGVDCKY